MKTEERTILIRMTPSVMLTRDSAPGIPASIGSCISTAAARPLGIKVSIILTSETGVSFRVERNTAKGRTMYNPNKIRQAQTKLKGSEKLIKMPRYT